MGWNVQIKSGKIKIRSPSNVRGEQNLIGSFSQCLQRKAQQNQVIGFSGLVDALETLLFHLNIKKSDFKVKQKNIIDNGKQALLAVLEGGLNPKARLQAPSPKPTSPCNSTEKEKEQRRRIWGGGEMPKN